MIIIFAPKLYKVRKIDAKIVVDNNYFLVLNKEENDKYLVNQQDNMMFRQCRLITNDCDKYNSYIVFIDCKSISSRTEDVKYIVENGFSINNQSFTFSERSGSMTRNSILSFIDTTISEKMNNVVSMGVDIGSTVLSKYLAYRGLMFSSCHCIENWLPKIIVVPDYETILENRNISYVEEVKKEYVNREGIKKEFVEKIITQGNKDVPVMFNDGCGLCHPLIAKYMEDYIGSKTPMASILLRAPYIKGLIVSIDYTSFYKERGVDFIQDVWGRWHDVEEPMIILTKSQYKGFKYFKNKGTSSDWDDYWERFQKYNHCIGVAKWNFSKEEEPIYTRLNYQVLQTNSLPYEKFVKIAKKSIEWIENIVYKDPIATLIFLGVTAENCEFDEHNKEAKLSSDYIGAIKKNTAMLNEPCIKDYLKSLLRKYIDEFKCGKLWVKGCFKFLLPDLIMMMEYIGGLEPNGSLEDGECWSVRHEEGKEYLIERNPHICASEDCILVNHENEDVKKYCSHLENVCMINGKGLVMAQLNGADQDGDIVIMIDDELLLEGARHDLPITLNIDDKATALEEMFTKESISNNVVRGLKSMIGEISNYATSYHNKCPKSDEQKKKYSDYINLLSVLNGIEIDSAKTGLHPIIPPHIAKYARPLPYFMKYTSPYYSNMRTFNHSYSNMNRLAKDIEKWQKKEIMYKRVTNKFDYNIMFDKSVVDTKDFKKLLPKIRTVYLEFCAELKELSVFQGKLKNYDRYRNDVDLIDISKAEAKNMVVNWNYVYQSYRNKCLKICPDISLLANICVYLQYVEYKTKSKKFVWKVCPDGLINNIKKPEYIELPFRDEENGFYDYLGKKYSIALFIED